MISENIIGLKEEKKIMPKPLLFRSAPFDDAFWKNKKKKEIKIEPCIYTNQLNDIPQDLIHFSNLATQLTEQKSHGSKNIIRQSI